MPQARFPDMPPLKTTKIITTKAGGIEIRTFSEHQNYNLENVHITTATLIKFARKIVY
jgi:hypothetical protein